MVQRENASSKELILAFVLIVATTQNKSILFCELFPKFLREINFTNFFPNLEHYVDVSRVTYLVHDVVVGENYFYHLGLEVWVVYGGIQHNPHQVGAVGVAVDPHSTPAYFQSVGNFLQHHKRKYLNELDLYGR